MIRSLSDLSKILFSVALIVFIGDIAVTPMLRNQKLEEEAKEQARAKEASFKPSSERPRTVAHLEPEESHAIECPFQSRDEYGYWTGIAAVSACITVEMNNFFVKDWCPGNTFTMRDAAGTTPCEALTITAQDKPVDVHLFFDRASTVALTPEAHSRELIITPGFHVMLQGGRDDPELRRLSWTPLKNCIYVSTDDGQILKSCPQATYSYGAHFSTPTIHNVYLRAADKQATVLLTGTF